MCFCYLNFELTVQIARACVRIIEGQGVEPREALVEPQRDRTLLRACLT